MGSKVLVIVTGVVVAVVLGLGIGVWNLIDTNEPVAPVQLQP